MRNRGILSPTGVLLAAALAFSAPVASGQSSGGSLLEASESDQVAFLKSALDHGLPNENGDGLSAVVRIHSAVLVPLIEQKIEDVLSSPEPARCFTAEDVDPKLFVIDAASMIAYSGDENGLAAITKLLRIDEKQFGRYVAITVGHAYHFSNPMTVAYRGLELDDPVLEKYVLAWVAHSLLDVPNPEIKRFWAEALVDRYGRAPLDYQWEDDPIVSRLPKESAQVHDEVVRLANEVAARRAKK
jgi:hypothetical protein